MVTDMHLSFHSRTHGSFATTGSQLKMCDFSGETFKRFWSAVTFWVQRWHNCSPAASFANCVTALYLLKVHPQTFLSIPITQKCQILSCDTLVANERCSYMFRLYLDIIRENSIITRQEGRAWNSY